jgi:hypothetical protein
MIEKTRNDARGLSRRGAGHRGLQQTTEPGLLADLSYRLFNIVAIATLRFR